MAAESAPRGLEQRPEPVNDLLVDATYQRVSVVAGTRRSTSANPRARW
jgi:hypothetical protein